MPSPLSPPISSITEILNNVMISLLVTKCIFRISIRNLLDIRKRHTKETVFPMHCQFSIPEKLQKKATMPITTFTQKSCV